jgi:hypothetical protein
MLATGRKSKKYLRVQVTSETRRQEKTITRQNKNKTNQEETTQDKTRLVEKWIARQDKQETHSCKLSINQLFPQQKYI